MSAEVAEALAQDVLDQSWMNRCYAALRYGLATPPRVTVAKSRDLQNSGTIVTGVVQDEAGQVPMQTADTPSAAPEPEAKYLSPAPLPGLMPMVLKGALISALAMATGGGIAAWLVPSREPTITEPTPVEGRPVEAGDLLHWLEQQGYHRPPPATEQ